MQVTSIRKRGKKLDQFELIELAIKIQKAFDRAGFRTHVRAVGLSGIHISENSKCFTIDPNIHARNAKYLRYRTEVGLSWKRTLLPTWQQRVQFNNILNQILDKANITASIRSGIFTIRSVREGAFTAAYWSMQAGGDHGDVVELTAEMEAEATRIRKLHRAQQAKIARDRKAGRMVKLEIMYGDSVRETEILTDTEYRERRLEMSTGDFHTHRATRVSNLKLVK